MKSKQVLVTGYQNPDIDAVACAFAYAEFLNKKGVNAIPGIFGMPHPEAQFVLKKIRARIKNAEKILDDVDTVILVDASDLRGISNKFRPSQVIEIIDHRKVHQASRFPKAKIQIDFVGAAATLIAEKFYNEGAEISKEAALLLYSAILSNTINFHASVTTKRDIKISKWLKNKIKIPKNYVHEMFSYKSNFGKFNKSLKQILLDDTAYFNFGRDNIIVVQLEIIDAKKIVKQNLGKISKALDEIKKEKNADFIFLTCIDVEKYFNLFVVSDKESEKLVSSALDIKFRDNIAIRRKLIMRKQIAPVIKEFVEGK